MKILIVDDSKGARMIVRRTLHEAGYEGHVIEEAAGGKEAIQKIQLEPPDMVLADWNMPEMSGMDLLQAIKKGKPGIIFGFVTSESTPEMRQRAKEEGALFLISKPFTCETFKRVLSEVIS